MRIHLILIAMMLASFLCLVGCGNDSAPHSEGKAPASSLSENHGVVGEQGSVKSSSQPAEAPGTGKEEHEGHHHVAQHGGSLIELPDEIGHVEAVLDKTIGQLTLYFLDGEAEEAVRVKQDAISMTVSISGQADFQMKTTAQENVLTGESANDSSMFVGTDDRLKGVISFTAKLDPFDFKGASLTSINITYPEGNEPSGAQTVKDKS